MAQQEPWRKWGPYLSERQWGTVREDYSGDGNAWNYFTHDQARSRAYRWGEDGLGGLCDDEQRLCFALALWNGVDPILKERLFGLANTEGNHGEDVKEYYFYLDSTPTHSYMKYLYKYSQRPYPYTELVAINVQRDKRSSEYELLDMGVFEENRYFDVMVEYAKAAPEDILVNITVHNRGPEAAALHVLPSLWFRNTWEWSAEVLKPNLKQGAGPVDLRVIAAIHHELGDYYLYCEHAVPLLFTENESNNERIFGTPNASPYVKDGINNFLVHGNDEAVNPGMSGTKAAAHYALNVAAGGSERIRLRFTSQSPSTFRSSGRGGAKPFGPAFDQMFDARRREADAFYAAITPPKVGPDAAAVLRQALAGMLWSKQFYRYDVDHWLREHGVDPLSDARTPMRNREWFAMECNDILSMPDKWEYPWFAAWDLAFHALPLTMVDPDFAKQQLSLMLDRDYLHPNGQIPAYEWNFSDVNPPVHAWATYLTYHLDRQLNDGTGDLDFYRRSFDKLVINFTWWVNRKDPDGNNVFGGGFLGLDNIGVFDRSSPLPTGGTLEQSDGTAWMAFYSATMLNIAVDLLADDPAYQDAASKFFEHFMWIAATTDRIGVANDELWDDEDGFFHDVLRFPSGDGVRLKVRTIAGLLPLAATVVFAAPKPGGPTERILENAHRFLVRRPQLQENIAPPFKPGHQGRLLLSAVNEAKLRKLLSRMLDENEFLSPYGLRSLSRHHKQHPYMFTVGRDVYRVDYEPAESTTGMFGGNSNWRGPIWMPLNFLLVSALIEHYHYYGDAFVIECPTGSGRRMTLYQVAEEIARRLAGIFLKDEQDGDKRPVYRGVEAFAADPNWRDHILFFEYFNGDTGQGLGASHQTGWTGLVANLIAFFATHTAEEVLENKLKLGHALVPAGELVPEPLA